MMNSNKLKTESHTVLVDGEEFCVTLTLQDNKLGSVAINDIAGSRVYVCIYSLPDEVALSLERALDLFKPGSHSIAAIDYSLWYAYGKQYRARVQPAIVALSELYTLESKNKSQLLIAIDREIALVHNQLAKLHRQRQAELNWQSRAESAPLAAH